MTEFTIYSVKNNLCDKRLLNLLALSIFNPTPERVQNRAIEYMNSNAFVYACKADDAFYGIVIFRIESNHAVILNIATDINRRDKGIASKMLDFILTEFSIAEMAAETDDGAVGFYSKYGFTVSVCGQKGGVARYRCVYRKAMPCFCGHDCSRCVTYLATVSDDDELRKMSQQFYKDEFGYDIPLSEIRCMGGRSDDVFKLCHGCPWMKCCRERGIMSCADCSEYPCKPLADYQAKYVNKCNQI
jgi:hypothetical protein